MGYAILIHILVLALLPETLPPRLPGSPRLSRNPFGALIELRHPFVAAPIFMTTVSFASFYTFPPLIPRDWNEVYGFNSSGAGFVMMASEWCCSFVGVTSPQQIFFISGPWDVRRDNRRWLGGRQQPRTLEGLARGCCGCGGQTLVVNTRLIVSLAGFSKYQPN